MNKLNKNQEQKIKKSLMSFYKKQIRLHTRKVFSEKSKEQNTRDVQVEKECKEL
jgi:hypothetical protein